MSPSDEARAGNSFQQASTAARGLYTANSSPMQLSWRQRLTRALRLPVGRASTIETTSSIESPRHAAIRNEADHAGSDDETPPRSPSTLATRHAQHGGGQSIRLVANREQMEIPSTSDIGSMQTNVATVHSDDYQTIYSPTCAQKHMGKPTEDILTRMSQVVLLLTRVSQNKTLGKLHIQTGLNTSSGSHRNRPSTRAAKHIEYPPFGTRHRAIDAGRRRPDPRSWSYADNRQ
ncbi:hypothetical protein HIM_01735 [Hirsutella minnesotensis 3608]|nr:hypothetical protein HIM_01735 [Hirsutella minnesotensis 3608]